MALRKKERFQIAWTLYMRQGPAWIRWEIYCITSKEVDSAGYSIVAARNGRCCCTCEGRLDSSVCVTGVHNVLGKRDDHASEMIRTRA